MEFKNIILERVGSFLILTINRAEKHNALSTEVLAELQTALKALAQGHMGKVAGMILQGAGERAFVAGADIKEMSGLQESEAEAFAELGQSVPNLLETLEFPVIACVDGFALGGGCEIAMGCDFIFATNHSIFGQPEVSLGLIPCFGGCYRLPKWVGLMRARELIFTGRAISAAEAKEYGLVLKTAATKRQLVCMALKMLEQINKQSILAVGISKKVLNSPVQNDQLTLERVGFVSALKSENGVEGVQAFLSKREAQFT